MSQRAWLLCVLCGLYGCVLPDYKVLEEPPKQPLERNTVDMPFGDADCNSCVKDHCQAEYTDCGETCGE